MMNNKLKNNKGITLVALTITIIIIIIVTNVVIYNVKDNLGIEKLRSMENDIEQLSDKISTYYSQYGTIPCKIEYDNITNIEQAGLIGENDTGKFYIIDLSAIENLTLIYGKDYETAKNWTTKEDINDTFNDLYIINESSHNIFYVKGIEIGGQVFYTNYTSEDVDSKKIDLRYVENIKIPNGYTYIEGTKQTGIIIKKNDSGDKYTWVIEKEQWDKLPNEIQAENQEELIRSVNLYGGYYKNNSTNEIVYLSIEESWSEEYDKTAEYKDKNGDIAIIPQGFKVSKTIGKNTINQGLVIEDKNKNSYVWIKVPKSIYVDSRYTKDNDNMTVKSSDDYTGIYNILSTYASEYRDNGYKDEWYALDENNLITENTENLTDAQKKLSNGCGLTYDQYRDLRNQMLKSIYTNGGFWISQYEIGTDDIIKNNSTSSTPLSQMAKYPYNYITCIQAQELAQNMNYSDFKSSLLFGIQYDLACKFIKENTNKTKEELLEDSTTLGNYKNSTFIAKNGKYSSDEGVTYQPIPQNYEKGSNAVLLTTGASERNSILNIYDLAGNVAEMTLEQSSDSTNKVTIRGGDYADEKNGLAIRENVSNASAANNIGFRIGIY